MRIWIAFGLALMAACSGDTEVELGSVSRAAGTFEQVSDFGSNPAQLKMYAYVPADMPESPRPLVVAMHGCSQSAQAYTVAGWHEMADQWKLYLVYPEQNSAVNNSLGCFNWGASWDGAPNAWVVDAALHLDDLERGRMENQSIIDMVDHMKDNYPVDDNRVYVTGLSAGGGMTALMLAVWPDVFAAGAIVAGVPYGCVIKPGATTEDGKACVNAHPEGHELNRSAQEWGDLVRAAYPGYSGPYPRVTIWQGTADYMVAPALVTEHVEQWTNVHGIDMTPDATEQVGGAEHAEYQDGQGRTLVETYTIPGMSHGQPVSPADQCGTAGPFILDVGICAASASVDFFDLDGPGGPNDPDSDAGPGDPGTNGADGDLSGCGCDAARATSTTGTLALLCAVWLLVLGRLRRPRW